ncbi:unnamed protein product [Mytilus edulis]|uniref:Uncharacterized protein n=1 Tax=Mytilus edulis TaxID=6550 RepID=A0A8S3VHG3_MYTED|nr:unnamed protein product [Mytilus edulis]
MLVVKFVVLLVCFALNNAFLLDNTPSTGQTLGSNQYLTVDDKVLINHELDEIRRDHERSLNILTSQLQQKFADLEKALSQNKTNSELLRKITGLQNENQELQTNFTELQRSFYILQNNYDSLKLATESQTMNLKTDVISLKQLQSIQQLQGLQDLRSKVHTIDSAVNILQSHELARNQDFISFYNTTRYEINKLQGKSNDNEIEINRLNIFLANNFSDISSRLGSLQLLLEKQIKQFELQKYDDLRTERFQNQSLTSLQRKAEKLC